VSALVLGEAVVDEAPQGRFERVAQRGDEATCPLHGCVVDPAGDEDEPVHTLRPTSGRGDGNRGEAGVPCEQAGLDLERIEDIADQRHLAVEGDLLVGDVGLTGPEVVERDRPEAVMQDLERELPDLHVPEDTGQPDHRPRSSPVHDRVHHLPVDVQEHAAPCPLVSPKFAFMHGGAEKARAGEPRPRGWPLPPAGSAAAAPSAVQLAGTRTRRSRRRERQGWIHKRSSAASGGGEYLASGGRIAISFPPEWRRASDSRLVPVGEQCFWQSSDHDFF
jgi:hypothetical protein